MPADELVTVPGSGSAPLSYEIAGAQEIILRAARATFDGTAAAASFLPAFRITDGAGQEIGTYPVDTAVSAGASADVSFAPFLRGATAGSTPVSTGGLPNAVMIKTNTQTIGGNSITQITLSSGTFATTDGTIFTASGSNIVVHTTGLYAAYIHFVDDNSATDPTTTQFYPKWLGGVTNPNNPWQYAVPREFNVNGPSGLQGSAPVGGGLVDMMANYSFAYVSEVNATVGAWLATLSASAITTSTCIMNVVQLQPIASTTLASFPSYPF